MQVICLNLFCETVNYILLFLSLLSH